MKNQTKAKKPVAGLWDRVTRTPLVYLLFFVLAFLIYGQAMQFFLGKLDEDLLIIRQIDYLKNLHNLPEAVMKDPYLNAKGSAFYRPLQTVSYMIDSQFFMNRGSVFFVTNILLHAAVCSLFFYLLTLLHDDRKPAFLVTLLFLVSPLFVQAIVWAPSRGDLLSALTGLGAVIFFARLCDSGKWAYGLLSVLVYFLALLSKETSLILLPVLALFWLWFVKAKQKPYLPALLAFGGYLSATAAYFGIRSIVVDLPVPASEFGIVPLLHNLRTIPEFLAKFCIPVHLSPMPGFTLINTLVGLMVMALLIGLMVRYAAKPFWPVLFGPAWFLGFALPGLMYRHPMGNAAYDYLEHRAYLPMLGIMILLFFIYSRLPGEKNKQRFTRISLGLTLILGIWSFVYAGNYKTPESFYNLAVRTNPHSAVAFHNRGCYWSNMEEHSQAVADFDRALALKPDYSLAYLNKGISLYALNDRVGAMAQYDSAIRLEPGLFQAHYYRAGVLYEFGRYQDAIRESDVADGLNHGFTPVMLIRGLSNYKLGDFRQADKDFSRCIQSDANDGAAYLNRGLARFGAKDSTGACADWTKALQLGKEEARPLLEQHCRSSAISHL